MIVNYTEYVHPDPCTDRNCMYRDVLPLQPHYHYVARFSRNGIMTAAIRGSVEVVQLEMWNESGQDPS